MPAFERACVRAHRLSPQSTLHSAVSLVDSVLEINGGAPCILANSSPRLGRPRGWQCGEAR